MITELLLFIGAFAIYCPSLKGSFCGDDPAVLKNPMIEKGDLKGWLRPADLYENWIVGRGLVLFTYTIDSWLAEGLSAPMMHVTNIVLHGVATLLVLALLQAFGLSSHMALLGAVYWLVNPLMVNAVANIAGRSSVLAAIFSTGAILAALTGQGWLAPPLLLLAFLSKQDAAITLPLVGILLLIFGHPVGWLYLLATLAGAVLAWKFYKQQTKKVISQITGWPPVPPLRRYTPTFIVATLRRLPKWFLGFGHGFSPSVPEETWNGSLPYIALASLTAVLTVSLHNPLLNLVLLLTLLSPWVCYTLTPMPDVVLEHRAYMLGLPFALIVGFASPFLPLWLLTAWFALLAGRSARRASAWTFGQLNKTAIEDGSVKPMVLLNRGAELLQTNPMLEAEQLTLRALEVCPNVYHGWGQLGTIYSIRKDAINSYRCFRRGAFRCPDLAIAWLTFGQVCEGFGLTARAMACYKHVLDRDIGDSGLAELLFIKVKEKHENLHRSVALDLPDSSEVRLVADSGARPNNSE